MVEEVKEKLSIDDGLQINYIAGLLEAVLVIFNTISYLRFSLTEQEKEVLEAVGKATSSLKNSVIDRSQSNNIEIT